MTVTEIREHAERLQGHLEAERRKVKAGEYSGSRTANLNLVAALEGRIDELLGQCRAMEDRQPVGITVLVLV